MWKNRKLFFGRFSTNRSRWPNKWTCSVRIFVTHALDSAGSTSRGISKEKKSQLTEIAWLVWKRSKSFRIISLCTVNSILRRWTRLVMSGIALGRLTEERKAWRKEHPFVSCATHFPSVKCLNWSLLLNDFDLVF